jgi:glycosyltransferase involved in cell wall biosynthesis
MAVTTADKPPLRVLFFGTHPKQFNGYSKVVYEICKEASKMADRVHFMVHGFQNFHDVAGHRADLPANVTIYDAFANENPKQAGFGVGQARHHIAMARPDVVVLYNDLVVVTNLLEEIRQIPDRKFKVITYIDQVYLNQKKEHIDFVNAHADAAIMFTDFWKDCILQQGLKLPSSVLPHAFNPATYFPVPKYLARRFFGLPENDFIILNLNRNQPRKRWDTCLKAFAELLQRTKDKKLKPRLVIATEMTGGWNLSEILERELRRRGLDVGAGLAQVSRVDAPQRMTDEDTNFLYNVADVGINTCDGEGFGLCNFEQAAIGIPQVVPRLGGFLTFFDDECAYLVEPKISYYVDASRDAIGGEALMCDHLDFADGLMAYYEDEELRKRHGKRGREKIVSEYKWRDVTKTLIDTCQQVWEGPEATSVKPAGEVVEKMEMITVDEDGIKQKIINDQAKDKDEEIKLLRQRLKQLMADKTTSETSTT